MLVINSSLSFQIIALTDAIEENDLLLRRSSARLSSATRLLATLTALWRHLPEEESDQLLSVLAPDSTYSENNAMVSCALASNRCSYFRPPIVGKSL